MEKQQSPEYEEFMICVDPESHLIYTLGLKTKIINIEDNVPSNIKEKAEVALKQLLLLRDDSKHQWRFQSNAAQEYRRREIPYSALLQSYNKFLYPTFKTHSKVPSSLEKAHTVTLLVDMSHYLSEIIVIEEKLEKDTRILQINARTRTGIDEVVKELNKALYDYYKVEVCPWKDAKEFVLKISDYQEYIRGNTALINYECVRKALRFHQPLQLYSQKHQKIRLNASFCQSLKETSMT